MKPEKPVGVPTRPELHKKIKSLAATRGKTMVELMDEIWLIYMKYKDSKSE